MKTHDIISNYEAIKSMTLGMWFKERWQKRLEESGYDYKTVATQMRKQGVPLNVALVTLCGKNEKETNS